MDKRPRYRYDWYRRVDDRAPPSCHRGDKRATPGWHTEPSKACHACSDLVGLEEDPCEPGKWYCWSCWKEWRGGGYQARQDSSDAGEQGTAGKKYKPAPPSYKYTRNETRTQATSLREGTESGKWVNANCEATKTTKTEVSLAEANLRTAFKNLLRQHRKVLKAVPPFKQGKHRMGNTNTDKMSNFMRCLLRNGPGRWAICQQPVVNALKEIFAEYIAAGCLTRFQIMRCLSIVRDELVPLGGQSDSDEDEVWHGDDVDMSHRSGSGYQSA